MKKFDLRGVKGVFANLRGGEKPTSKGDLEVPESLQAHDFFCGKLTRHGFPYHPTCMAWDPIQKLLAIGTKHGVVRLMGKPGVDVTIQHDSTDAVVLHMTFLVNEGALITACSDDYVNLWSYRQKIPEIVHSLKFCRERITCLHLPYQSKWLYLGTEKGNVHIVNVETFTVCGYTINWNKAIELSRRTHPGPVVHLSDNPMDPNKLLIGFESGLVICWDLRCKMAELRFNSTESLRNACWHQEGRTFMCSYADGTLCTWSLKKTAAPINSIAPHARKKDSGGQHSPCKPINRLEWKTTKTGEPFVIFSGGMPYDGSKSPCLTIMQGTKVTVLQMEHKILNFIVLCRNTWSYEYDDPYAIVVLLSSDLIVIDLTSHGYPVFQSPYALDIHTSPVTCLKYISDCASDLIPAIYSCGTKQLRSGYSTKEFPINGGECNATTCSYTEMLITGHADGTVKFWDASGADIQFLYRMRTSKQFDKIKPTISDFDEDEEDPLAIQHMYLDEESRLLTLAAAHHIIVYNYSKKETKSEVSVIEVTAINEIFEEAADSPLSPTRTTSQNPTNNNIPPADSVINTSPKSSSNLEPIREIRSHVRAKHGSRKHPAGYQPELIIILQWCDGTMPPIITSICTNSSYGMLAAGTTSSIFLIDTIQKTCLLNITPAELCNSEVGRLTTPTATATSPKKRLPSASSTEQDGSQRSPDQVGGENNLKLSEAIPNGCSSPVLGPKHRLRWKAVSIGIKLTKNTLLDSNGGDVSPPPNSQQSSSGHSSLRCGPLRDKTDGVFSRSRSPSTSSLDTAGSVTMSDVQFLMFADSYSRKQSEGMSLWNKVAKAALARSMSQIDIGSGRGTKAPPPFSKNIETMSSLWVGTSTGTLLALDVIPYYAERNVKPIMLAHSGSSFQLRGTILELCFLNCKGVLVPTEAEIWGDSKEPSEKRGKRLVSRVSRLSMSSNESTEKPATTDQQQHIAVMCSDSELRSVALPSQSVLNREKFPDGMFVVKATAIIIKDSACLACLGSNGNLMVYGLPSLRQLLNVNYFTNFDIRVVKTLDFSHHGHAMYMCSVSEIQKITVSADMCRSQPDMQCEPFLAKENPEPPKQSFLKSLFGSGPSVFDREELFGSAGKASHGVATLVPGAALQAANASATGLAADMARTRQALDERGEKLGKLEDRSEAMRERAKEFASRSSMLADRYKNLKWYQF